MLSRQGENVRQGVLADELGIEGPSLVRLIDLLQAEGLVERREDPTDRRAKTLHLTKAGEAKVEETNRILRRVRASLLKDIAPDELAITFETLQRIEQRASLPAGHKDRSRERIVMRQKSRSWSATRTSFLL